MEALSIYLQENMHMESICVFPTGGLAQKYRPCRTASGTGGRLEQDYPGLSKVDIISIVKALEALSSYVTK